MNTHKSPQASLNKLKQLTRIGILGGTFDPIHFGHINPAINAAKWLKLSQLTLLPAHIPPHKNQTTASALHRKAMVSLVCDGSPLFKLDDRELLRNSPSYTVETLKEIKKEQPQSQLFFIIGMDSLLSFTSWHQWREILSNCHLVVNARPEHSLESANDETRMLLEQFLVKNIEEIGDKPAGNIIIREHGNWSISSTQIRAKLSSQSKNKQNISDFLPESVKNYIQQQKLY